MEYPKIDYDYEKIKLIKVFEDKELVSYGIKGVETSDSLRVYGDIFFPPLPDHRSYTYGSFVTSIDGKVAFPSDPAGPVVAKANRVDPVGADADFWVFNLLRSSANAVIVGAGTMQKEPDGVVCIFDKGLEEARMKAGLTKTPWAIISSLDGSDIPFQDGLIDAQPVMFNTSPAGLKVISEKLNREYYVIGPYNRVDDLDKESIESDFESSLGKKIPVIVTGEGKKTDSAILLNILKILGMDRVIVESPSYCHSLMGDGLLDELALNYSCVYIGGDAVGLGSGMKSFTPECHPHTKLLSMHSHSSSFFYFRHKMIYDI